MKGILTDSRGRDQSASINRQVQGRPCQRHQVHLSVDQVASRAAENTGGGY
jgi:hypothetical protein